MRRPDYTLIVIIGVLLVFGLIMLTSASSVVALEKFHDSFYFTKRQLMFGVLPGLLCLLFLANFDYRKLRVLALPMFIGILGLLTLVFVPGLGETYGRAHSWVNIGGISFQPSEFAKLIFLIYLAALFASRSEEEGGEYRSYFIPFVILVGIMACLLILQPDLGTMIMIVLSSMVLYFVAGGRFTHFLSLAFFGALALYALVRTVPYRVERLLVFLYPELDPQGIGYQINQAFLAIGSGGVFGKGLGLSRQKFLYLTEVISDSIFAIISEELGFIIAGGVVIVLVFFAFRGFSIAQRAPDLFGRLLAVGITSLIIIQAFTNIGAIVGLLPLTGLPLPFISYGGSAMFTTLAAMGILVNISKFSKS